ncbi:hypothetical protein JCM3766R1_004442 [Sporobolomyces carnicolor]
MPRTSIRRARSWIRSVAFSLALAWLLVSSQPLWQPYTIDPNLARAKSVLWITAHPDDESFFFAPTILNLDHESDGHARETVKNLLCLSIGDYEGEGRVRRKELRQSCRVLGIDESRCLAIDHPDLPDDPNVEWPYDVVIDLVKRHATETNSDAIITFDEYGVSGHANHRVLHKILLRAIRQDELAVPVYAVRSSNVIAKYTSLSLVPFALLKHVVVERSTTSSLFVSSFEQFQRARRSFAAHQSQARWFRTLFVHSSRYLWYVQVDRVVP